MPIEEIHTLISRRPNEKGTVRQHDPAKNKLQSDVSKAVKAAIDANLETKVCNTSGSVTVSSSGTVLVSTLNLVRGDASVNECTGILIKPKHFRASIVFTQTGSGSLNSMRAIVFRWRDASLPTASTVLQATGGFLGPLSMINWVNHRKMTILADRTFFMYDHGGACVGKQILFDFDPGRIPIQLVSSGAGAVPQMNGIFLLLISDDALGNIPAADYYISLTYTDA